MKKINKGVLIAICACFLWLVSGTNVLVAQAQECAQSNETITTRADIIEWRYKVENGRMYCRQYNCTKGKWIGEWELC